MLQKVLGEGKVQAVVTVDANFDRAQQRKRLHEPVTAEITDGDGKIQTIQTKVAERLSNESTESTEAAGGGTGVGAFANRPEGAPEGAAVGQPDTSKSERKNSQISYNYNNIEELISKDSGVIQRKSISVQYELPPVVEGEDAAEGGPPPLQNDNIQAMVEAAVNFQEGDQISVNQVKFDTSAYDKLKEEMLKAREGTPWWIYLLVGLGGLVVGAGIGGALLGKKKAAAGAEQFGAGMPQYQAIPGAPMPGGPGMMPGAEMGQIPGAPGAPGLPMGQQQQGMMPAQQAQEVSRAPIMPPTPDNPFGFLQGVTPQTVAQLLSTERLPTLVAVLAQLDPGQAEDVINLLNPEIQNEVRTRLAQNPVLPPMTQKMVSQSLKKRLAAMSSGVV